MTIQFVPQREGWDCGIACLAMLTGTRYDYVLHQYRQGVTTNTPCTRGVSSIFIDQFLAEHGYAVMRVFQNGWGGLNTLRKPVWPLFPVSTSILRTRPTLTTSHFVVVHNEILFDPAASAPNTTLPVPASIVEVTGVVKVR